MTARARAVVLSSGGMDSCVTLAIALQTHDVAMFHCSYGQRTASREIRSFHAIADHYGIGSRLVVSMEYMGKIGGSSLTDHSIPVTEANLSASGIPSSYVPFRNANMLSAAVSWAEVIGAHAVFVGAVEEDSSGYPDCRREFYDAFESAVRAGTKPGSDIAVVTPVIRMKKVDIIRAGIGLGAPLHLTWSCYSREDVACGVCDSCALRLRGFRTAGVPDPIPYDVRPDYA